MHHSKTGGRIKDRGDFQCASHGGSAPWQLCIIGSNSRRQVACYYASVFVAAVSEQKIYCQLVSVCTWRKMYCISCCPRLNHLLIHTANNSKLFYWGVYFYIAYDICCFIFQLLFDRKAYLCPDSWAIVNARPRPVSSLMVQLLYLLHIPLIGANPANKMRFVKLCMTLSDRSNMHTGCNYLYNPSLMKNQGNVFK